MKTPFISIVIPTYNRKKMTERLITSILKGTYKNIEIIVIDDASTDNTSEYLGSVFKNNKKINLLKNKKNLFAAGSKNEGQKHAKGKYIAFIDDDNVIDSKMIEELVKELEADARVGEVGPINYSYSYKNKVIFSRSTRNMWTTKTQHLRSLALFRSLKSWETDDIPNAFMARASVLNDNKIAFNPKFGIMYEESDFAYRIREAGYKIIMVKKANIYHDIEDKETKKNYLYHFLEDSRRPFVFARNRIIFHYKYSTILQKIGILILWCWIFAFYYSYKFIYYKGPGGFDMSQRVKAATSYLKGNLNGIYLVIVNKSF